MNADRGDSSHISHLIPEVSKRLGHHHRRDDLDNDTYVPVVARAVTAERDGYNDGSDQTYIVMAHGQANAERVKDGSPSLTCNHEAPIVIAIGFDSKQGGETQLGATEEASPPLKGINRHAVAFQSRIARNGRGQPTDIAPALRGAIEGDTADSKPLLAGNFGVRRLTPRECERLMGLPDDWTAGFSDSVRYRMIGNSAAVPVIEWLATAIAKELKK